jgi:hypothetical protein
MADESFEFDVFHDLFEDADAIGRLARTERSFVTAYEAFRSQDRKAFQAVLRRLGLVPYCHRVCDWIRIKECLLLCLHLCGPPKVVERPPNPRVLAEAIVRITSDEKALKQLVQAIEKRDRAAFQRLVRAHELGPICHLFCHWVCYVRYRLVCRWVCDLELREPPDLVLELQTAGQAMRALLEQRKVFNEAVAAANANDAQKLGAVIQGAGLARFCDFICFFFCNWRCVLLCLTLCRHFPPVRIDDPLKEAFAFARATRALAQKPAELRRLSAAVGAGDEEAFAALVEELKLQRFCIQLCQWLCFLRCRRFCIPVCPPIYNHPWFTHVGDFDIYGDIDPGTGLTNKQQAGHGGPDFGFFGCLKLRGFCPKYSPAFPGQAMAYRFLFEHGGTRTPITGGFLCEVLVGTRLTFWAGNPFALQSVRVRGTGTTSPTPPPPGPSPSPPDHFIVPDPQGWITVDANALDDGFNGWLLGFASPVGFAGGDPAPGVPAGTAVPAGSQKNGVDAAIIFQATRVSTIAAVNGGAVPDYTNQLSKIHINNWNEVRLLDLLQFHTGGGTACSPLTTDLDIEYTVDHALIRDWSISLSTAAGVSLTSPPPPPSTPRGGAGTHHEDISAWPTCSYAVQLHTRRRLTDGLSDDSHKTSQVTFCIGRAREREPR